jgi:hypothetical protein
MSEPHPLPPLQADRVHLGSFLGASDALGMMSPAHVAAVAAQQAAEERASSAEMLDFQSSALAGMTGSATSARASDSDSESMRGNNKDPFMDFLGVGE